MYRTKVELSRYESAAVWQLGCSGKVALNQNVCLKVLSDDVLCLRGSVKSGYVSISLIFNAGCFFGVIGSLRASWTITYGLVKFFS